MGDEWGRRLLYSGAGGIVQEMRQCLLMKRVGSKRDPLPVLKLGE